MPTFWVIFMSFEFFPWVLSFFALSFFSECPKKACFKFYHFQTDYLLNILIKFLSNKLVREITNLAQGACFPRGIWQALVSENSPGWRARRKTLLLMGLSARGATWPRLLASLSCKRSVKAGLRWPFCRRPSKGSFRWWSQGERIRSVDARPEVWNKRHEEFLS